MRGAFFFLLVFSFATLCGETVTPTLEKETLFLGEPVVLTVPVSPGKEIRAEIVGEQHDFALITAEAAGDRVRIVLSATDTGSRKTPPLILHNDGAAYEIPPMTVSIAPNTTENATNLRDIKPPVTAYEPDYTLLWIGGALIVLAALFVLLWHLSKRRRKQDLVPTAQKTPYHVALEYRRRAEKQLHEMDYESFADTVTAGLRHYLELVKQRPFLEMTTGEIRRTLKKSDVPPEEAERIVTFLGEADRFKYADEPFSTDRFSALLDEFSRIIERLERHYLTTASFSRK